MKNKPRRKRMCASHRRQVAGLHRRIHHLLAVAAAWHGRKLIWQGRAIRAEYRLRCLLSLGYQGRRRTNALTTGVAIATCAIYATIQTVRAFQVGVWPLGIVLALIVAFWAVYLYWFIREEIV